MNKNKITILLFLSLFTNIILNAQTYRISDYGAINDGLTINTKAVQKAIDECTNNGGGTVMIDGGGKYTIGTIYLKSNVTLHVANGTTLLGSPNIKDYTKDTHKIMYKRESHMNRCLIFAKDAHSIAIEGNGTIDGNGSRENFPKNGGGRPMLLRFLECNNIRINNISLMNPAAWTTAFLYCNDISIDGVTIISQMNRNGDGLDFDGCTRVRVSNCNLDNNDDCICLQASHPDKPCKDVVITNCILHTDWGGIRIGLLSRGNIENVTMSNCTFRDIKDSGLKIQQCEGGEMKNMTFTNLVMKNVPRPIFMTFAQQRASVDSSEGEYEPLSRMHNMVFSNIIVDNTELDKNSAFFLTGMPGHYIEDILIKDVQYITSGGGSKEDALKKDHNEFSLDVIKHRWPEFSFVGTLPAYGIYARHMDGLTLENISIKTEGKDERVPIVFKDVKNAEVRYIKANGKFLKSNKIVKH